MKPFTGRLFQTNIDNPGRVAARTRVLGFFEGLARSVASSGSGALAPENTQEHLTRPAAGNPVETPGTLMYAAQRSLG